MLLRRLHDSGAVYKYPDLLTYACNSDKQSTFTYLHIILVNMVWNKHWCILVIYPSLKQFCMYYMYR